MNPAAEQLYAIATGPTEIDWRAAFAQLYESGEAERKALREENQALTTCIAELEAAQGDLPNALTALARRLTKLEGDSCCAELIVWCRKRYDGTLAEDINWRAYSSRRAHSQEGKTIAETEAKFRATIAAFDAEEAAKVAAPEAAEAP